MADIRVERLARLLTAYSVEVRNGDEVLIRAGIEALPLVRELYKHVLIMGGNPHVILTDDVLDEIFYRYAGEDQLKHLSPIEKFIQEKIDVSISIISRSHSKPLVNVDPEKLRIRYSSRKELMEIFMKRQAAGDLRWVVSIYPTNALAQEAEMAPLEYEEFVYTSCMLDSEDPVEAWKQQAEKQRSVIKVLEKLDEIRVVSNDTDLFLKVGGRRWINDDGHNNMPAGEVFSAPIEDSVEGYASFTYPAIWRGIEIDGITLKFKRGRVVEAHARKGEEKLLKLLKSDEGAERLGEIAFGLNYRIKRYTRQILFDEKIGGTMHMALGAAYPETGGVNKSSIHLDMILDMRGGKLYGDGDLIYENGHFTTNP